RQLAQPIAPGRPSCRRQSLAQAPRWTPNRPGSLGKHTRAPGSHGTFSTAAWGDPGAREGAAGPVRSAGGVDADGPPRAAGLEHLGEARLTPAEDERLAQPLGDLALPVEELQGPLAQRFGQWAEPGGRLPPGGRDGEVVVGKHGLDLADVELELGERRLPAVAERGGGDVRGHQPTAVLDATAVPGSAAAWCQASRSGSTSVRPAADLAPSRGTVARTSHSYSV